MMVLTLSVCIYGGDMHNGRSGEPAPTPTPTNSITEPAGDEPAVANSEAPAVDPSVTEVALSVLQSILSVF
jgi:hypothetical protein